MRRSTHPHPVKKIISGGQTGVDRAALDVAIALGIPHGGWCPAGRLAEDGSIPRRYVLQEAMSTDYAFRTEQNVLDSDATLIVCRGQLSGGTELTHHLARRHKKPLLVVDLCQEVSPSGVLAWLRSHRVATLNVAGPRESTRPGISKAAQTFLTQLLADGEPKGKRGA